MSDEYEYPIAKLTVKFDNDAMQGIAKVHYNQDTKLFVAFCARCDTNCTNVNHEDFSGALFDTVNHHQDKHKL